MITGNAAFHDCAVTPNGRLVVVSDGVGQIQVLEILLE
jgi:hypothetical protein